MTWGGVGYRVAPMATDPVDVLVSELEFLADDYVDDESVRQLLADLAEGPDGWRLVSNADLREAEELIESLSDVVAAVANGWLLGVNAEDDVDQSFYWGRPATDEDDPVDVTYYLIEDADQSFPAVVHDLTEAEAKAVEFALEFSDIFEEPEPILIPSIFLDSPLPSVNAEPAPEFLDKVAQSMSGVTAWLTTRGDAEKLLTYLNMNGLDIVNTADVSG